jgi:hypothetical protein
MQICVNTISAAKQTRIKVTLYSFLHAPHSRERLYTSRKLLTLLLTYHQVMPSFLDFIFPFGRQENANDFYFSGFRQETRLEDVYKRLQIPEIGRSGREIRMCYNLKSVEPSEYQPSFPWSIRQTAVYHSLDVETGQTFWIILKGDELIKERIEETSGSPGGIHNPSDRVPWRDSFASSLATHMIICDWCGEDLRWYISYLEQTLQEKTRRTLAVKVETPASPVSEKVAKSITWNTVSTHIPEKSSFRSDSFFKRSSPVSPLRATSIPAEVPPARPSPPGPPPPRSNTMYSQMGGLPNPTNFSFADLQQVQLVEDKANEVLLILESNVNVLTELKEHYRSVTISEHCPEELIRDCSRDIQRFEKRIVGIINDLRIQQSRTTTLLRLLADRKSLVCCPIYSDEMSQRLTLNSCTESLNIRIWRLANSWR